MAAEWVVKAPEWGKGGGVGNGQWAVGSGQWVRFFVYRFYCPLTVCGEGCFRPRSRAGERGLVMLRDTNSKATHATPTTEGTNAMLKTLQDLFVHELKDVASAEDQLTKALPKMMKAAQHPDLKEGFA